MPSGIGEPIKIFEKGIQNVVPGLKVKSRRVGGATYQVPVEVRPEERYALAMRWIITAARERGGKDFASRLAAELTDAANGAGSAIKKDVTVLFASGCGISLICLITRSPPGAIFLYSKSRR